jgi:prepilin-type N-terminal cleavage/methylation domain-containing protein
MNRGPRTAAGFTLVEVVVALGVLAVILATLGSLYGPATATAAGIADRQTAARLGDSLQCELERLQAELGFERLALTIPGAESGAALRLVAVRDGRRILRADGAAPAADRPLDDGTLPGIAQRDRYFLIEVTQQIDLPYAPGAGFLAVSARVTWPYKLPVGPATAGETRPEGDPAREVPAGEREWTIVNLALRP